MSLGLVAYGSSDESDNDDLSPPGTDEVLLPNVLLKNSSKDSTNSTINLKLESTKTNKHSESSNLYTFQDDDDNDNSSKDNMLLSLPAPKLKLHDLDVDVKKLKSSGTVRISIPSLSQLDSEESAEPPSKKKLKPSQKGSGLFALLPTPKNQGLVPQSVGNRVPTPAVKPKSALKPRVSLNPAPDTSAVTNGMKKSLLADYDDSGDEDDESNKEKVKLDFFSLEKDEEDLPMIPVPEASVEEQSVLVEDDEEDNNVALTFRNDMKSTGWSRMKTSGESSNSYNESTPSYPSTQNFMSVSTDDLELDEEALQHLCGRRDRNKMQGGNMQLIDVSGDAIMPDSREWLTKQLTEEKSNFVQSHKRKDGPTSQQRRKHQITYLAFQAKEHELELKNQWANNRVSRKQTQAKYGF